MSNRCCDDVPALLQAPKNTPPVEWCAGNFTLRYKDGKVTKVPRTPTIADGVYTNAIVRMVGGCIAEISSGPNTVFSACDPCVDPPTPPPPAGITIDGSPCNLSTLSADGLLTQLIPGASTCISLSGCGTTASPLVAQPVFSPDAGNALECRPNGLYATGGTTGGGTNFSGCGIQITNGLVVALPLPFQPILSLVSTDSSVIISRDPANPCIVNLSANPTPTVPTVTPGGIIVVTSPASLPNPATAQNWMAAVGAANPRDVYVFQPGTLTWHQLLGVTINA